MPPQNAGFYHAAYIAAALIYAGYSASLLWRLSQARRQLRDLEERQQRSAS
jgi:hypothetical protein